MYIVSFEQKYDRDAKAREKIKGGAGLQNASLRRRVFRESDSVSQKSRRKQATNGRHCRDPGRARRIKSCDVVNNVIGTKRVPETHNRDECDLRKG